MKRQKNKQVRDMRNFQENQNKQNCWEISQILKLSIFIYIFLVENQILIQKML